MNPVFNHILEMNCMIHRNYKWKILNYNRLWKWQLLEVFRTENSFLFIVILIMTVFGGSHQKRFHCFIESLLLFHVIHHGRLERWSKEEISLFHKTSSIASNLKTLKRWSLMEISWFIDYGHSEIWSHLEVFYTQKPYLFLQAMAIYRGWRLMKVAILRGF